VDSFREERAAFAQFRSALASNVNLREEVGLALRALLTEYDTTIRENRFTVGGAVEHIIGAAMRAAEIDVVNRGKTSMGSDLALRSGRGISVKASFTDPPGDIRLVNTLGDATGRRWTSATILVLAVVGVGYVDPELLPGAARAHGDAIILPRLNYMAFLEQHPEWVAVVDIPVKPRAGTTKVASYAVAEEILSRDDFNLLRKHRTSVSPG